jgi:AcrR family transcriptional regulator
LSPAPRSDARRSRDALLRSGAKLLAARGAAVPMTEIAAHAGVGVGTLYRHFPDRAALVSAVYAREIERLGEIEPLLADATGAAALEAWLARFVAFGASKRALGDVLVASGAGPKPSARGVVLEALDALLAAGARDGTLREDVDGEDVLLALAGLWSAVEAPDWRTRAERLARLVLDGVRAGA